VKNFLDAEAMVIGHLPGAGKHKGRLGALSVRLPSGVEFSVGTGFSDRQRGNPPAVGSTVTFRYQELSEGGVPRFPSFVGVRLDAAAADAKSAAAPLEVPSESPVVLTSQAPDSTAVGGSTANRHFEFTDGKSNKFWEISRSGSDVTTRWGRIGTAGQSKTKIFVDESAAIKQEAKLIGEKTGEGYVEK
jgi:DNA ligase-1